jgi:hypothetical protein
MDLLGTDEALADIHALYRCHDRLLAHKQAVFDHLVGRWRDLFNASFDVLLYDLTSTYFEANPPFPDDDKRRFGYSRDKRSDCVQVVIALIVTPEGLPLAYEVLPGNTADCTTLKGFLERIERQYGKARRVWVMDRGIPTNLSEEDPAKLWTSASRASADDTWRSAASVRRRSTLARAENGGFISTTVGVTPGSRWSAIRSRSGSGSQPVPSSRRSASRAMSVFLRSSISCVACSPFASRTASRMRALVTRPR